MSSRTLSHPPKVNQETGCVTLTKVCLKAISAVGRFSHFGLTVARFGILRHDQASVFPGGSARQCGFFMCANLYIQQAQQRV
jgi:hypothetical protein